MCKHKSKKLREFEPILNANGYHEIRSCGSHFIYGNGKNQITVNKDLNKMVRRRLIKENKLSKQVKGCGTMKLMENINVKESDLNEV